MDGAGSGDTAAGLDLPPPGARAQLQAVQAETQQGVAGFTSPHKMRNNEKAACHIDTGGGYGSGSLVDGTPAGFPATCILTNQHVIGTEAVARGTTVRFNYESDDSSRWIEVRLDPDRGFIAHKSADLDFCLVAVASVDTDDLTKTLSKAHDSNSPAALQMRADAPVSTPMPITIWQHPRGGFKQHSSWVLESFTDTGLTYQNDTLPVHTAPHATPSFSRLSGALCGRAVEMRVCRAPPVRQFLTTWAT